MWPLFLADSEEWGEDEIMLLVGCSLVTVFAIWWIWSCLATVPRVGRRPDVHTPLLGAIASSFAFLVFVTWSWTAVEIRGGRDYAFLALAMGGAWFAFYARLFRWLGIGLKEDACERTNPAAVVAVCGAIPGGMLLYCGAICGEGPSFWNNVFTVLAAGAGWFTLWLGLEIGAGVSRAVAEDRDLGSGWRLAAFLLASGLILGRAAAGNWESAGATLRDMGADGWPAAVLMVLAAIAERGLRPRDSVASAPASAFGPAAFYLLFALAWVGYLGPWAGFPG